MSEQLNLFTTNFAGLHNSQLGLMVWWKSAIRDGDKTSLLLPAIIHRIYPHKQHDSKLGIVGLTVFTMDGPVRYNHVLYGMSENQWRFTEDGTNEKDAA